MGLGYSNIRVICQCEEPKGVSNNVPGGHFVMVCQKCGLVIPREKTSAAWRISQYMIKKDDKREK